MVDVDGRLCAGPCMFRMRGLFWAGACDVVLGKCGQNKVERECTKEKESWDAILKLL